MMKTIRTIAASTSIAALAIANPVIAEEAEAPATEVAAPAMTGEPALWKVADEDTTIYLFGTVHALPKNIEWYDEDISAALTSSDEIVTEIDMAAVQGPEMQQLVMTTAILPEGTTLRALLTDEQRASYEAAMGSVGLPAAAFDRFEPWYAGMTLSMLPLMQQGYTPEDGVESVLLSKAGEMERGALETVEFQLGVFDQLPQKSQIEFLIEASENIGEVKAMIDAMVVEWLEGDAEGLAGLMNEGMDDEALAEALLFARNRNWVDWIDTRLATPGTVFMAVGAGHLAGENSVQDYLEERGHTVTRIQ